MPAVFVIAGMRGRFNTEKGIGWQMSLKEKIEAMFDGWTIEGYEENVPSKQVSFTVNGTNEIDLKRLTELSVLLGTDAINFSGRTEDAPLSEVTPNTDEYGCITAYGVDFEKGKDE
jgi:hypothetical protein